MSKKNWEETVIHLDDINEGRMPDSYASLRRALEKQAKITGDVAFKEGIKEVFKWGDEECDCGANIITTRMGCNSCLSNKQKEWGLK